MTATPSRRRSHQRTKVSPVQRVLRSYWTWIGAGGVLVLGALLLSLAAPGGRANAAPDFSLAGLDGEAVALSDYRGQYVLVNFWATWCPPCRAELPDLVSFYHDHADEGFILIGVNEQETAAVASAFLNEQNLDFLVVTDTNGAVLNRYGTSSLPSSFLIDPDGVIVQRWSGMISRATLEAAVTPRLQ
ncbi:MAG: TlpA family protein disulfide reductase [Anaerolineae bacterium]|nr:TlpA family protein disulfide reductase [Anaerolineae bacterium]